MRRHHEELPEQDAPLEKSKTQLKNEMLALQQLGVKLCSLTEQQLRRLDLPDNLLKAIIEAKRLKSNGAIRRQAQYIGKIMRQVDSEPILAAYQQLQQHHQQDTAKFHQLERWRDRLIAEGDAALTEFLTDFSTTEMQQLRQLIKNAQADRATSRNSGASRRLLQLLKSIIK